jgi:hypothetical protein
MTLTKRVTNDAYLFPPQKRTRRLSDVVLQTARLTSGGVTRLEYCFNFRVDRVAQDLRVAFGSRASEGSCLWKVKIPSVPGEEEAGEFYTPRLTPLLLGLFSFEG